MVIALQIHVGAPPSLLNSPFVVVKPPPISVLTTFLVVAPMFISPCHVMFKMVC